MAGMKGAIERAAIRLVLLTLRVRPGSVPLPDPEAETHGMLWVVDEDKSEPDGYLLYPASHFATIDLPESAQRALAADG